MRVRFQADANLNERIVRGLRRREPAAHFRTDHAAGLTALPGEKVLLLCAGEGRILVTQDRRTMAAHFRQFTASAESPGVILIRRKAPVAVIIDDLI